jgi:hypothetical protein
LKRTRAVARRSVNENEEVRPLKYTKGREPARLRADSSAGAGVAIPEGCQICLQCFKHLHLEASSTFRGRTIVTGFLCGLGPFYKCSYCAHTKHDCE